MITSQLHYLCDQQFQSAAYRKLWFITKKHIPNIKVQGYRKNMF